MKGKIKINKVFVKRMIQLACIIVFIFSAKSIIKYQLMTKSTRDNQKNLAKIYEASQTSTPESSKEPEATPQVSAPPVKVVFTDPPQAPKKASIHDKATLIPENKKEPVITATPEPAMSDKFVSLYRINDDVKGWLKLNSVHGVDFPVVHKDNEFYLNRDFYQKHNAGGTAFLDVECSILPKSDNLIIHGHNMKNGTMFGKLYTLLNLETLKSDPFAYFDTLYEQGVYVPYSVSVVSLNPKDANYASIYETNFSGDEAKAFYINELRSLSYFNFPIDVSPRDELLTLITCHGGNNEQRLVVAYRRLRSNENQAELLEHIRNNTQLSGKK